LPGLVAHINSAFGLNQQADFLNFIFIKTFIDKHFEVIDFVHASFAFASKIIVERFKNLILRDHHRLHFTSLFHIILLFFDITMIIFHIPFTFYYSVRQVHHIFLEDIPNYFLNLDFYAVPNLIVFVYFDLEEL
jgi:hypothetical protein